MGLVTKEVEISWHPRTKKYYESLGYVYTSWKDKFIIFIEHLSKGSGIKVDVECDNCGKELNNVTFCNYNNYLKDEKYYCHKCSMELFGTEKMRLKKLNNGISFAQYLIDSYGEDAINRYWSDKNMISPYDISYSSTQQIYINCLNKSYHREYLIHCNEFAKGQRCPYCNSNKVHVLDSLGTLCPEVLEIWSENNTHSAFELSPMTWKEIEWKCKDGLHENYIRQVNISNMCNFRCPRCNYYKGEKSIKDYLISNNFTYIDQKKFNNLKGVGNSYLSYDFFLPQYNLLIEHQGKQHKKHIPYFHKSIENFHKQQEHDKRKREYANTNNIDLLEIWYWDFDNIENILNNYFDKY